MANDKLALTKSQKISDDTSVHMLNNGTLFYHKFTAPKRLYVKWKGGEIEADLPDGEIHNEGVQGDSIVFVSSGKIYKASYTVYKLSPVISVSCVRKQRVGEELYRDGFFTRVRAGHTYVYRMCDNPDQELRVDISAEEWKSLRLIQIHRKKAIYCKINPSLDCPIVRKQTQNSIVVELSELSELTFHYSTPDTYAFILFVCNLKLHTLSMESLQFLPPVQINGADVIHRIAGVHQGIITVEGKIRQTFWALTASLPDFETARHSSFEEYDTMREYRERMYRNEKDREKREYDQRKRERVENDEMKKERERKEQIKKDEAIAIALEQQMRKREELEKVKRMEKEREMNENIRKAMQNMNVKTVFESEFLKKFKPRKILGQGGFGCVFEARNLTDNHRYAVKRIPLRGSNEAINDALKEVITLAPLSHEGIVGYRSSWVEKPPKGWQKKADSELMKELKIRKEFNYKDDCVFIYIQMELCKQTLDDWLSSNSTRDLNQAKSWFKQIVSAVAYLHKENKIHRDLKPCNILFDMNDRIKICDLGLVANRAMKNGQEIDLKRSIAGTPMYMAPEQLQGNYTSKVDIFSLGLILVELCVQMTVDKAYEVFEKYREGRRNTVLRSLPEVDSFVSLLTKRNAAERPTCEQILNHAFMNDRAELERDEVDQCAICMERPRTIAFRCGHRACPTCSRTITICHICRKPITDRIRIY